MFHQIVTNFQSTELDVSLDYMIDVFAEVENVNTSNFVSFPKLDHYVLIKGVKNILDDIQTDEDQYNFLCRLKYAF